MKIELAHLSCGYRNKTVLHNLSLSFASEEICSVIGPNGVGKTTLFKTLLGFLEPLSGTVLLDGNNIRTLSPKSIARIAAYVPQAKKSDYQHSVLDVVLMGRALYIPKFGKPTEQDIDIAERALDQLGIKEFRDCPYDKLSGGEQQIVLIARALVQEARFIIMDEPASNLDFGNTKLVLDLLSELAAKKGIGIIMSTHSPDHAFYSADKVLMISNQNRYYFGTVANVLSERRLSEVYGIKVSVLTQKEPNGERLMSCCFQRS